MTGHPPRQPPRPSFFPDGWHFTAPGHSPLLFTQSLASPAAAGAGNNPALNGGQWAGGWGAEAEPRERPAAPASGGPAGGSPDAGGAAASRAAGERRPGGLGVGARRAGGGGGGRHGPGEAGGVRRRRTRRPHLWKTFHRKLWSGSAAPAAGPGAAPGPGR